MTFAVANTNIVRDGLAYCWDVGNVKSFPGYGTTLSDLVGGNTSNLWANGTTCPVISTDRGWMKFNATESHSVGTTINQPALGNVIDTYSISVVFRNLASSPKGKLVGVEANQFGQSSTVDGRVLYIGSDGKLYFGISSPPFSGKFAFSSISSVSDGRWHVATATSLGGSTSTSTLYLDGVQQSSASGGSGYTTTSGWWRLGGNISGWTGGGDGYYDGHIAHVAIYKNKVLSGDEVLQNYHAFKERFYPDMPVSTIITKSVVLPTNSTFWAIPSDWSNANNAVEAIGGGAGGTAGTLSGTGGNGGAGGSYSKALNVLATLSTIRYQSGTGGGSGAAGNDTWLNGTGVNSAPTSVSTGVLAKGGGSATSSIGMVIYPGGAGGNGAYQTVGGRCFVGGGGGGAAGPNGAGGAGTTPTYSGSSSPGGTGGAGDAGSGGSGGAGSTSASSPPVSGSAGTEWGISPAYGSGGGGGGASVVYIATDAPGGAGGSYGGGGGGGWWGSNGAIPGGAGSGGIIRVTYKVLI